MSLALQWPFEKGRWQPELDQFAMAILTCVRSGERDRPELNAKSQMMAQNICVDEE
jgi:hypothetical protein